MCHCDVDVSRLHRSAFLMGTLAYEDDEMMPIIFSKILAVITVSWTGKSAMFISLLFRKE